jgi:hypothetical protein
MGWDWEWMQHCVEIAEDFQSGQGTPGAYFYIFRPGFESAKKVSETEKLRITFFKDTQRIYTTE